MTYTSVFKDKLFAGKVILVTGGGSGIGRCTAHELAALGAQVVLLGRNLEKLQAVAAEIETGWRLGELPGLRHSAGRDRESAIGDDCEAARPDRRAGQQRGRAVHHAAGKHQRQGLGGGDQHQPDRRLFGGAGVLCAVHAGARRRDRQHRGRYLGLHAGHGAQRRGAGGHGELDRDGGDGMGASGVRVNAVAPGYIASSGMDHYPPEAGPMLREMRETVPLGRFGNEAETSAAIVFLLSPAASFISGTMLRVDGARPQVRMGWGDIAAPAEVRTARCGQAV